MDQNWIPLTLRAVQPVDLPAMTGLINQVCAAAGDPGAALFIENSADVWRYPGFNPEQDAFLVHTGSGLLVGYGAVSNIGDPGEVNIDLYIHPDYKGRGVEAVLLGALEERIRSQAGSQVLPGQQIFIRVPLNRQDEVGRNCLRLAGYAPIYSHWRMGAILKAAPPPPELPAGLEFREFAAEAHLTALWRACDEAFQGNWSYHEMRLEEFSHHTLGNPEYDPQLWTLICDQNEIVGFAINQSRLGLGWIRILGVQPAWRPHNLRAALLQRALDEFHRRGIQIVSLGLDAETTLGTLKNLPQIPPFTVSEFVVLGKELRCGQA